MSKAQDSRCQDLKGASQTAFPCACKIPSFLCMLYAQHRQIPWKNKDTSLHTAQRPPNVVCALYIIKKLHVIPRRCCVGRDCAQTDASKRCSWLRGSRRWALVEAPRTPRAGSSPLTTYIRKDATMVQPPWSAPSSRSACARWWGGSLRGSTPRWVVGTGRKALLLLVPRPAEGATCISGAQLHAVLEFDARGHANEPCERGRHLRGDSSGWLTARCATTDMWNSCVVAGVVCMMNNHETRSWPIPRTNPTLIASRASASPET